MAIQYTTDGIIITDDTGTRPPILLPPTATQADVDAAAAEYHSQPVEPDVLGFFSELSRNPAMAVPIGDLLAEMMQPRPNPHHAPQAALGLGVGLGQVADKGDPRVFLDAWHQALERGLLGPELIAGVQQLAQTHNLPAEFIAALQPDPQP